MILWNFDLPLKTMVLSRKLWYYGQNYGAMEKTIVLIEDY